MFRILQVKQNQVKDELISYAHLSEKWVKEIYLHTEINLLTVFAQPTLDKDNVNFVTSFTGQYEEIDTNNPELYSEFIDKHQKKVTKVIAYLNNTETFSDSELNSSKEILCSILKSLDKKYIFEKRNVIAIPYFLKNYSEPTPIVPSKTPFNKSWYLSLTLIPLIVGLLFYFCNDYIYGQKKCFTVDAQNQYPQFTIAFDASESMLEKEGNVDKLSAAKGATKTLIKNIYPNIDINFIEINGCPYAQNKGLYSYKERDNLIELLDKLSPIKNNGTPLVDALQKISESVDGVRSDAVGILITDGQDSCEIDRKIGKEPLFTSCKTVSKLDVSLKDTCQITNEPSQCSNIKPSEDICLLGSESAGNLCMLINNKHLCTRIKSALNSHCIVTEEIHKKQPRLKIHTVMIGNYDISCISKNTGGNEYRINNINELNKTLLRVSAPLTKICK